MPITAEELLQYGKSSIDLYMKNNPIDSINPERPFLKMLMEKKKETVGGKQYLVKQLRKANDSNFQTFYGSDQVSYNRKDTLEQAFYEYDNFHDGFTLHEDDFIRNGIVITEGGPGKKATASEKVTLTNILTEQIETLRLGFEESLDVVLHNSSGTNISDLVPKLATGSGVAGLADMLPENKTQADAGKYAGIDRSSNVWWRTHAINTALTTTSGGTLLTGMRQAWRAATKYGGRPDFIMCGSTFLDGYIDFMLQEYGRVNYTPISKKGIEGAEGEVSYQGVPLIWNPTFDTLSDNGIDNTDVDWKKRCYFINTKHMKLMPIKGQHMISRTPPRVHNKYEYYWALTDRFYLCMDKPRAHAVIHIA